MSRFPVAFAALAQCFTVAAAPVPTQPAGTFLVQDTGLAFLGPDGREVERLDNANNGALSPDGRHLACIEHEGRNPPQSKAIIRPRAKDGQSHAFALVRGEVGSGCRFTWAADGRRVFILENWVDGGVESHVYRTYDLATKATSELKLPGECDVTGCSADGRRLLATIRTGDSKRVAWLAADGAAAPEFITPAEEVAYNARLSPDGRRVVFQAGPKPADGGRVDVRLTVIDLASKKRTTVDEAGATHGHCWSADGKRVAYTWQRPLKDPQAVRETFLMTCDADGGNRKTVTSRKYTVPDNSSGRSGVVIFFSVLDWH